MTVLEKLPPQRSVGGHTFNEDLSQGAVLFRRLRHAAKTVPAELRKIRPADRAPRKGLWHLAVLLVVASFTSSAG
jgi:hypothetical protein